MTRAMTSLPSLVIRFTPAYFVALHIDQLLRAAPSVPPPIEFAHGVALGTLLIIDARRWIAVVPAILVAEALAAPAWGVSWIESTSELGWLLRIPLRSWPTEQR